jgi:hypothetical protein
LKEELDRLVGRHDVISSVWGSKEEGRSRGSHKEPKIQESQFSAMGSFVCVCSPLSTQYYVSTWSDLADVAQPFQDDGASMELYEDVEAVSTLSVEEVR